MSTINTKHKDTNVRCYKSQVSREPCSLPSDSEISGCVFLAVCLQCSAESITWSSCRITCSSLLAQAGYRQVGNLQDVDVMAPSAYFGFFWSSNGRVRDLAESLQLAKTEASKKDSKVAQTGKWQYAKHLKAAAALFAIENGSLVKARNCF